MSTAELSSADTEDRFRSVRQSLECSARRRGELVRQAERARERRREIREQRRRVRSDLERRWAVLTLSIRAEAALLEAAFRVSGYRLEDVWLAYTALAGNASIQELGDMISGEKPVLRIDHDRIAHALNEHLEDLGFGRPLAYWNGSRSA